MIMWSQRSLKVLSNDSVSLHSIRHIKIRLGGSVTELIEYRSLLDPVSMIEELPRLVGFLLFDISSLVIWT